MERPAKRTKLLSDSEDSDVEAYSANHNTNGVKPTLNINKDFARRFEHNKQREEKQRLEEKLKDDDGDESSTDESEDDEADLITDDLDDEIMTTLQAIKSKDPRVYNKDIKFYSDFEEEVQPQQRKKKDVPMTLKDYHRENLLAGYTGAEEEEAVPMTYAQEQDSLRQDVVMQMHAAADSDNDSDGGFKLKAKGLHEGIAPAKTRKKITSADVVNADQDPETFLSNFMASQAWRAGDSAHPHAFDSDNSDDDARADAFEEAYNMRFEDPATANETLKSFARDSGKYSVRREEVGGRKKAREREKQAKADAKQERDEDRARLRKLKIDDAEKKLKAIKQAAGIRGKNISVEQWRELLEGDFSDDAWDKEMDARFGAEYYDAAEAAEDIKSKQSKPTWDDDIDIKDLVPDFDDTSRPEFTLSEDDEATADTAATPKKSKADREKVKREDKAQRRREHREIEDLVDASLPVAAAQAGSFRYRETSPHSFGLSARDILFASDAQLNQFAGLKKLASFRDEERKSRDRKKLGKKARLREWRKEVFGNADGAEGRVLDSADAHARGAASNETDQLGKKRKRSRKSKTTKSDA